jgi:hypothetical protein
VFGVAASYLVVPVSALRFVISLFLQGATSRASFLLFQGLLISPGNHKGLLPIQTPRQTNQTHQAEAVVVGEEGLGSKDTNANQPRDSSFLLLAQHLLLRFFPVCAASVASCVSQALCCVICLLSGL